MAEIYWWDEQERWSWIHQVFQEGVKEAEEASDAADDDELMDNMLFSDNSKEVLTDGDFSDFMELEEELGELDDEYLQEILGEVK